LRETTVYESAIEVREALRQVGDQLSADMQTLAAVVVAGSVARRERFAAAMMAALVQNELAIDGLTGNDLRFEGSRLARAAWQLADALDAADPQRVAVPAATAADDDSDRGDDDDFDGVDLSKDRPSDR
jgi:hypothetical protein